MMFLWDDHIATCICGNAPRITAWSTHTNWCKVCKDQDPGGYFAGIRWSDLRDSKIAWILNNFVWWVVE